MHIAPYFSKTPVTEGIGVVESAHGEAVPFARHHENRGSVARIENSSEIKPRSEEKSRARGRIFRQFLAPSPRDKAYSHGAREREYEKEEGRKEAARGKKRLSLLQREKKKGARQHTRFGQGWPISVFQR